MDLICTRCGEPWDVETVLHDIPQGFKRKGARITRCPSCPLFKPRLSRATKARLAIVSTLADTLGDDVDGFAATLEDFGLLHD